MVVDPGAPVQPRRLWVLRGISAARADEGNDKPRRAAATVFCIAEDGLRM